MKRQNPRLINRGARNYVLADIRRRVLKGEPCGICGMPIDLTLPQFFIDPKDNKRKRAPWSLECDEIVPIARGGSPIDPNNVQPAHRACNIRKGAGKRPTATTKAHIGSVSRRW